MYKNLTLDSLKKDAEIQWTINQQFEKLQNKLGYNSKLSTHLGESMQIL